MTYACKDIKTGRNCSDYDNVTFYQSNGALVLPENSTDMRNSFLSKNTTFKIIGTSVVDSSKSAINYATINFDCEYLSLKQASFPTKTFDVFTL